MKNSEGMFANLTPYPAYKLTEVSWLGKLPSHWEMRRLRTVAEMRVSNVDKIHKEGEIPVRLCNYVDVYKNSRITADLPFMRATATPQEIEHFRLHLDDVIITKDSETWNDIGVPSLVQYASPDLVCGYHLALLRPRSNIMSGHYLFRALQSQGVATQLHVSANGVTRFGLSHGDIKSAIIPVPPPGEQVAIARLLGHVDRRVYRCILAKLKLLKLLGDEKQAIIHRVFTRGLDPNVPLKPTRAEWLGDVPGHWEVVPVKRCAETISKGTTPSTEGREILDSGPVRFLKAENIAGGKVSSKPLCFIDEETDAVLRRSRLRVGDILFVIAGATLGKTAVVNRAILPANTNQAVAFIRPNRRVIPEYLALWLQSPRAKELTWLNAVQSAWKFRDSSSVNRGAKRHLALGGKRFEGGERRDRECSP